MRYVVVCVVKGEAGEFNNGMRKDIFEKFKARSSKLPAHFTIKGPFECKGEIRELEEVLEAFCEREKAQPFRLEGYDHFDKRVIYMHVEMSEEGKGMHDRLIDVMEKVPYIHFDQKDGKDKVFHVTVTSKKLEPIYETIWEYVMVHPCSYDCMFDNICIYNWEDETWKLYKEYELEK